MSENNRSLTEVVKEMQQIKMEERGEAKKQIWDDLGNVLYQGCLGIFEYICSSGNYYFNAVCGKEDCFTNTMLIVIEKLWDYRAEKAEFSTWYGKIVRNELKEHVRKARLDEKYFLPILEQKDGEEGTGSLLDSYVDPAEGPEQQLLKKELEQEVDRFLNRLPENYRSVLNDRFWNEMEVKEIARKENCKVEKISNALYRGKAALKESDLSDYIR